MRKILRLGLLAFTASLASCAVDNSHPPTTPLRVETTIERRATLSTLRRAWEERPSDVSDEHCWYERRLLDRSAFFGRKIRDSETYKEGLWFLDELRARARRPL